MRRLLRLVSLLSLVLCVGLVGLWVVSHWTAWDLHDYREADEYSLMLERDRLQLTWQQNPQADRDDSTPSGWVLTRFPGDSTPARWHSLGFDYQASTDPDGTRSRVWVAPLWPLVLLTALLPMTWLVRHARQRKAAARTAAGCCPRCGYNLTGNTSGVCPECSAAAAAVQ